MFVAPAGPPPVKISICPKVWNDPIKAMIVTKNRTGEMRGMVILNNFDQYPAPSISALSYNSWETFCMPPNNMMKLIRSEERRVGKDDRFDSAMYTVNLIMSNVVGVRGIK